MQTKSKTVRLFENEWLEALTRVPVWLPICFWGPVIFYLFAHSVNQVQIRPIEYVWLAIAGVTLWSLSEYLLHRLVFHAAPESGWAKRIVFLMHGVHHDYPNDPERLLMPPVAGIPIALCFWFLFSLILPSGYLHPFFGFFLIGYLLYDYAHYATHHWRLLGRYGRQLTRHHMLHHFSNPDKFFGVSSPFWDRVFGTL